MSDEDRFISGVRRQNERLKELLDSLESARSSGLEEDLESCGEVLRRVELDLRRLRREGQRTGKYEHPAAAALWVRF
ncbi:MAG: hypothetical protein MOGMAGMI_00471 [Candidatus Omnitrophica bacterium]|nr:hypothetical protein [Candidatus Omnitrophota bacterium]